MKIKLFAAASALALVTLSAPAAAQHQHHQPAPQKPAAKKAAAKKPAAKKTAVKKAVIERPMVKKPSRKMAGPAEVKTTAPVARSEPPATVDHSTKQLTPAEASGQPPATVDNSTMHHPPGHSPTAPVAGDIAPTPAVDHSQMDHSQMDQGATVSGEHSGHGEMIGALGPYPMTRESSGTAWQPDTSEHSGIMVQSGDWMLMGHGVLNLVYDHQSGRRGDDKAFASGMLMGMAQRPLGNGALQFKAMLSPDPLMGKRGYPLLLASGETANGTDRLIDRQHPHDFFMELSGSVSQNVGPNSSVFLYAGLPGEPAFGPPAFMHREAILDSPEAPITHHWLDSTHISFGVLTAGLVLDRLKVEISRFNGREPDQRRWNIETAPLDSTAVRLSWNPTPELALQGSWGRFIDPEQLEPGVDQTRWSVSVLYAREMAPGVKFAASLAWGRKTVEHNNDDAFAIEASLKSRGWTFFGRGEMTENRELLNMEEHGPAFRVGKISLGTVRDFDVAGHVSLGIGGLLAVNFVPDGLAPLYGGHNPGGAMGFVRLKLD